MTRSVGTVACAAFRVDRAGGHTAHPFKAEIGAALRVVPAVHRTLVVPEKKAAIPVALAAVADIDGIIAAKNVIYAPGAWRVVVD
jgi:hypothetical protein